MTLENESAIVQKLDDLINSNEKEHSGILEQVKRTNGTVADLVAWKWISIGAISILSSLILPVIIAVVIQFVIRSLWN